MVLLLYIQNQDKQKNDQKKNQIKFPEKKNSESCYYLKQPQKIPQQLQKILPHATIFFTSNEQEKKITKRKQNKQEKKK